MTPTARPVILIIEDDEGWQEDYAADLGGVAEILAAKTIAEARLLFMENSPRIALIVMDGAVPKDDKTPLGELILAPTTENLVREFRRAGFTHPIVAASSRQHFNDSLGYAGCRNHGSIKADLSAYVRALLVEMFPAPAPTRSSPDPC